MRSLRGALILWTSIGSVLVFSAAGVVLYFLLRTNLVKQIDGALQEKARWMAANTEIRGANFKLELGWAIDQAKDVVGERDDFEIWNSQGTVVYCSPRLLDAAVAAVWQFAGRCPRRSLVSRWGTGVRDVRWG